MRRRIDDDEEEEENVDTDFGGTVEQSLRVLNVFYKSIDDEENERRVIEKQHERDPNNVEIVEECQNMMCKTWDLEKAKMFAVKMQRAKPNGTGGTPAAATISLAIGMQRKSGVERRGRTAGTENATAAASRTRRRKKRREERTRSCPEN